MYHIYKISITFIAILLFVGCHSHDETGHDHDHNQAQPANENITAATLTADQIKAIGITTGYIEKKQLTASLKANGILKVPNQNRANVTSLMGGVINTILIQTGNIVTKGQVIATLTNNSFIAMQEEYLSTLAKYDWAKADFERQQALINGNAVSQKIFQQAETDYKTLQVKKNSLQKQLMLLGINTKQLTADNIQSTINVTSPISGTASNVQVNIGSYVAANNPIAEIVDNSQLHLDLYVYEKDLNKLDKGQTIHFTLTNNPGKEYDAKIYAVSNTFEQNTKAVAVHATVEGNKQGLIDGMNITAIVSLENALLNAVPNDAIVNYQGLDYVFIVTDKTKIADSDAVHKHKEDNENHEHEHANHQEHSHTHDAESNAVKNGETTFEKIPIKKGTSDIGYTEIVLLKEIPAHARVVTKGAFFILAKMTNEGQAHAH
ncbi:MAG: efflux RND transporter periplasmic adaptor subunit [Bacteroidia bacterium]|nr:efflux RND transporter periplasmic adaptor subunit [Bacteroidia bacterium]HQV00575.1 efflux RND transporter periplasmic adaptor subunit [Bacteroidia bacterium]